jgi:hypothetical protein
MRSCGWPREGPIIAHGQSTPSSKFGFTWPHSQLQLPATNLQTRPKPKINHSNDQIVMPHCWLCPCPSAPQLIGLVTCDSVVGGFG